MDYILFSINEYEIDKAVIDVVNLILYGLYSFQLNVLKEEK